MNRPARYRIRHATRYDYGADVVHSHQLLHLVPRPAPYQQCLEHTLDIAPRPTHRRDDIDAFGNPVIRVEFELPHRELAVTTHMEVQVYPRPVLQPEDSHPWEQVAGQLRYHGHSPGRDSRETAPFRHESPYVRVKQAFTDYAADCFNPGRPVLAAAGALMEKLHRELQYAPGATTIATPLMEVLEKRRGVCQDYAHLMIACLRSRGLAARYVSGYVRVRPPDAAGPAPAAAPAPEPVPQPATAPASQPAAAPALEPASPPAPQPAPALVGGGASHAWVDVYAPPLGWVELDPTNNAWVGLEHVAVAIGRDFGDVSPLRGIILGGGHHQLSVDVSVEPRAASPPAP
ncbi:MAG TPA: transglutaminase family protein [Steroidobacteraceae bacterium]|nr:transglutaminase family protein [Steroidobacteraceae bacterium]